MSVSVNEDGNLFPLPFLERVREREEFTGN